MSVVGFDIGNDGCFVAEIKRGGVDMVLNENSNRRTPNLVSIQEGKTRLTGEQASAIAKSNYKKHPARPSSISTALHGDNLSSSSHSLKVLPMYGFTDFTVFL